MTYDLSHLPVSVRPRLLSPPKIVSVRSILRTGWGIRAPICSWSTSSDYFGIRRAPVCPVHSFTAIAASARP